MNTVPERGMIFMKILTVAIPCYNSAEYMGHAIESVLKAGDEVEIIVVDDGSVDDTKKIGEEYENRYPDIVRCISKENGGHGSAVNTGLRHAQGLYYKVLDSDDWFDEDSLKHIMQVIKRNILSGEDIDMYIANYVYENQNTGKEKVINYRSAMPVERVFEWSDLKRFKVSQNILMHSVIYRTELLRECNLKLPLHTFYVDNVFVYQPLPYVKKMYYMDVDLYRYYIGRADQSVNEEIMMRRIDQQLLVTRIMIDAHDLTLIKEEKLRKYMTKYLTMMMTISSAFLVKENTEESLRKREMLWNYLRDANPEMADMVNHCLLGRPMQMKSAAGRKVIVCGYALSRRFIGFS